MLSAFLVVFGRWGESLGSQMVDLECQDTDWVDGDDRDLLEASLQPHTTKRKKKQQTKKEPRTMFKNCNQWLILKCWLHMQLILLVIIETSAFEKHLLSTRKVYCVIFIMIVTYFLKLSWIHRPAKRAVFAAQRQKQNGQIRDRKKLSNLFFFYFPCFLYHVERILGDKHMICLIPPPHS